MSEEEIPRNLNCLTAYLSHQKFFKKERKSRSKIPTKSEKTQKMLLRHNTPFRNSSHSILPLGRN